MKALNLTTSFFQLNNWLIFLTCLLFSFLSASSIYADDILSEVEDGIDIMQIAFIDTEGKTKRLADFHGQYILLNFMYTSCHDVCPVQTASLAKLQNMLPAALKSKTQFVSITLNPNEDTPGSLLEKAMKFDIDKRTWSFFKGSHKDTQYIASRFSTVLDDEKIDLTNHRARIYILDHNGNLLLSYPSSPLDTVRVLSDLKGFNSIVSITH